MTSRGFFSWTATVCGVIGLLILPSLSPDGSLWVLAIVCAAVAYDGFRAVPVYTGGILILIMEAVYGLDAGVISVSFALAIVVVLGIRRFISMTPWSRQDGWALGDGIKSIVVGWLLFAVALTVSAPVGDALYGYGVVIRRMRMLWEPGSFIVPLVLGALAQIILRRMVIPFRRAILFGS